MQWKKKKEERKKEGVLATDSAIRTPLANPCQVESRRQAPSNEVQLRQDRISRPHRGAGLLAGA